MWEWRAWSFTLNRQPCFRWFCRIFLNMLSYSALLWLAKKLFTTSSKLCHVAFSVLFLCLRNGLSRSILRTWGPSKTVSFNLESDTVGNLLARYAKHVSPLFSGFTRCLINPSLIWRSRRRIFDASANKPGATADPFGHFLFFVVIFTIATVPLAWKEGYLLNPDCCPVI